MNHVNLEKVTTITVELIYCGHHWDRPKCPHFLSEVVLHTKATFGIPESVLIIEVSLFQSVLIREVPLYNTLPQLLNSSIQHCICVNDY